MDARLGIRQRLRACRQIPAFEFDRSLGAGWAAQRKDAGHIRQLAQGDAIDEILPATVDGIPDLDHVFAVLGDFILQDRVGVELVVVGMLQFMALGVVKRHGGLEPARHGVRKIGDQFTRRDYDHKFHPLAGLKAIAIHAAGQGLAINDGRQRYVHLRGLDSLLLIVESQRSLGRRVGAEFKIALVVFHQLADAEAERIG